MPVLHTHKRCFMIIFQNVTQKGIDLNKIVRMWKIVISCDMNKCCYTEDWRSSGSRQAVNRITTVANRTKPNKSVGPSEEKWATLLYYVSKGPRRESTAVSSTRWHPAGRAWLNSPILCTSQSINIQFAKSPYELYKQRKIIRLLVEGGPRSVISPHLIFLFSVRITWYSSKSYTSKRSWWLDDWRGSIAETPELKSRALLIQYTMPT